MIKVGQIYKNKFLSNIKIVITQENLLVLTQSEHIRLHANKRKRGKNGKFEI